MERLLIVSNRLPWKVTVSDGEPILVPAAGGQASALLPWHERFGGKWVGWSGHSGPVSRKTRASLATRGLVPVELTPEQVERCDAGFSHRVLWPVLHYLVDRVPVDPGGWEAYQEVNALFADQVVNEYHAGDSIWIHDYQLMLLPALLRQRVPEARIGFFLHVPFPAAEVFRTLPWRNALLSGLLGADLVGFQTFSYLGHFLAAVRDFDGVEIDLDRVRTNGRSVQLGVFPMSVDAVRFSEAAGTEAVAAEIASIRQSADNRAIVLGIDRLDYTKGILRRLEAIERLLLRDSGLAERMRYIQIAVPSGERSDADHRFRREVEGRIGRINGDRATVSAAPIHYVHRSIEFASLVALYASADVMLVTPLRDGMNLVAKEFVATRRDGDGVLILSEFAGAASELDGALLVNPYDVDATAAAIERALTMPAAERRVRMHALRRQVLGHDVHQWAEHFLRGLSRARPPHAVRDEDGDGARLRRELATAQARGPIHLVVDYDGTLVPFAATPDRARPDAPLLDLLARLATQPGLRVSIVSGRPREVLETWLGHLPVDLWAEHGLWHRALRAQRWERVGSRPPALLERIQPILDAFTATTPGSLVERKSASVAWHYRNAADAIGARHAREIKQLMSEMLRNQPFEVLEGKKVVEIRQRGINKGEVVHRLLREDPEACLVAIGDDHTDEDLFRALPEDSISIGVGERPTDARFVVAGSRDVRQLLEVLCAGSPGSDTDAKAPTARANLPIGLSSN